MTTLSQREIVCWVCRYRAVDINCQEAEYLSRGKTLMNSNQYVHGQKWFYSRDWPITDSVKSVPHNLMLLGPFDITQHFSILHREYLPRGRGQQSQSETL